MKTSDSEIQTFSFGQDLVFEAYIMFKEYIGFVKAMNSLKGMKLLYKDRYEDRAWVANIKVSEYIAPIHMLKQITARLLRGWGAYLFFYIAPILWYFYIMSL
jgi:hypothetical protein